MATREPTPYGDDLEHVREELQRLDLLLRIYLERWWAEHGGSVDEFSGLYVSDEEVDRLLRPSEGGKERRSGVRAGGDRGLRERVETLTNRIRARRLRGPPDGERLRLARLSDRFGLERRHVDALLIGLAPELDEKYEKVYAYLQDDVTKRRPTVGLALRVLSASETERLAGRTLFSRRSPLVRDGLLHLSGDEGTPLPSRAVTVDERIVDFLLGGDEIADELAPFSTVSRPERTMEDAGFDEDTSAALEARFGTDRGRGGSETSMIFFHGPYGSGKGAAVEVLCAERETPLLTADARKLIRVGGPEALELLIREARLRGAVPYVEHLTPFPDEAEVDLERVIGELDGFDGPVFLSGEEPPESRLQVGVETHEFATLRFPVPSYERRRELWEGVDSLPEGADAADLAAKFRLTGGQIADAVSMAGILAGDDGLSEDAVYRGCRAQSNDKLDSLARKIDPSYTWDDIVLPRDTLEHLREVAIHIEHQGRVYAEWGFEDKFSLGNGLNVLFSGASGTGKTMAAEIIAGEAELDLYKIDLSSVVSKYIGETEKNLREIFDEAEDSSAILFFDEADALFGKRSEVKDSHDRYANIEVNYLLQRVEEHDGTVILTTNFEGNIDDAFLRRIHLSVDFPLPDEASREAIWRAIFPEETPVGDLDFEFLTSFEIAGGSIKNVALNAAFLAAEDASAVEMEHVIRGTMREFQKIGKLINPAEFGEYRELLT